MSKISVLSMWVLILTWQSMSVGIIMHHHRAETHRNCDDDHHKSHDHPNCQLCQLQQHYLLIELDTPSFELSTFEHFRQSKFDAVYPSRHINLYIQKPVLRGPPSCPVFYKTNFKS